jgi:hypothetical protein
MSGRVYALANQKGGVGKTTSAANIGALLATRRRRVLVVDIDPQYALTRQLGLEARSLGVNLVDVMAGRAGAAEAIVPDVHGIDVMPGAGELAGVEMSLVGELGRERFLHDALEPIIGEHVEHLGRTCWGIRGHLQGFELGRSSPPTGCLRGCGHPFRSASGGPGDSPQFRSRLAASWTRPSCSLISYVVYTADAPPIAVLADE